MKIDEMYYQVTVKKIVKGHRATSEYIKKYDSDHPKMMNVDAPRQYEYEETVKAFIDSEQVFEIRCDKVNLIELTKALDSK
jgi:hypothetical protein